MPQCTTGILVNLRSRLGKNEWEVVCLRIRFSVSFSFSTSPRQGEGGFTLGLVWPLAFFGGLVGSNQLGKGFEFVWKKFWMSGSSDHFTHPLSASDQTHQTLPPPVKIVANVRLHRLSLRFISVQRQFFELVCELMFLPTVSVLVCFLRSFFDLRVDVFAHALVGSATSLGPLFVCTCCGKQ